MTLVPDFTPTSKETIRPFVQNFIRGHTDVGMIIVIISEFQCLDHMLRLIICLGMISGAEVQPRPQSFLEPVPKVRGELRVAVGYNR